MNKNKCALLSYFHGVGDFAGLGLNGLSDRYTWPKKGAFPEFDDISLEGSNYEKNIQLKQVSRNIFLANVDTLKLAKYFVSDWGGVRSNRDKTLNKYISWINEGKYPDTIGGIASYSKLYSFYDPDMYAIYDARVAVSLNMIQFIADKPCLFFPYLKGRNRKIEAIRVHPHLSKKTLLSIGFQEIKSCDVYRKYNTVLLNLLQGMPKYYNLYHLEMSLFADAEILADIALKKII